MKWTRIIWDDLPGGNVEHVEEHDLTTDEVDHVLEKYVSKSSSRSSCYPCVFGYTGRSLHHRCLRRRERHRNSSNSVRSRGTVNRTNCYG